MTREKLEEQIGIIAVELHRLNRIVAEGEKAAQKADRLRVSFQMLMRQYLGENEGLQVLFKFNGKNKDLLKELRQELEKVQKINPSSF